MIYIGYMTGGRTGEIITREIITTSKVIAGGRQGRQTAKSSLKH